MPAPPQSEIRTICERVLVNKVLTDFLLADPPDGLGLVSLADFANYFTEAEARYEVELQTKVMDLADGGSLKDDGLARSRIRTAWKLARAEFSKACARMSAEQVDTDWDAPLGPEEEKERSEVFGKAYDNFSPATEHTPMRAMISRYVREFRSADRHVSLTDTRRIRSEAQLKPAAATTSTPVGPSAVLVTGQTYQPPAAREHGDVGSFLESHRLLCMSWAMSGATLVESKTRFNKEAGEYEQVRQCHLEDALGYHWFVESKAFQFGITKKGCIDWIMARDLETRSMAKKLFRDGYPWGEAIYKACRSECFLDWKLATDSAGNSRRIKEEGEEGDSGKEKKRKAADVGGGQASQPAKKVKCADFNSDRGCAKKERNCPHKHVHRCTKCGNWNHGASTCRSR